MLMWLSDRSQAACDLVKHYLLTHSAAGNNIGGNPITVQSSGLRRVYAGAASAALFGVPPGDPRHPDDARDIAGRTAGGKDRAHPGAAWLGLRGDGSG